MGTTTVSDSLYGNQDSLRQSVSEPDSLHGTLAVCMEPDSLLETRTLSTEEYLVFGSRRKWRDSGGEDANDRSLGLLGLLGLLWLLEFSGYYGS